MCLVTDLALKSDLSIDEQGAFEEFDCLIDRPLITSPVCQPHHHSNPSVELTLQNVH